MRLTSLLLLSFPLTALAVDLSYTPATESGTASPPAAAELPRFQLSPDSPLIVPAEQRGPSATGNPVIDRDLARDRAHCERIRQRMVDQGKFSGHGCD